MLEVWLAGALGSWLPARPGPQVASLPLSQQGPCLQQQLFLEKSQGWGPFAWPASGPLLG